MDDETNSAIEQLKSEIAALRTEKELMLGRIFALEAGLGTAFARWGHGLPELATQVEDALDLLESDMRSLGFTAGSIEGLQGTGRMLRRLLGRLDEQHPSIQQ